MNDTNIQDVYAQLNIAKILIAVIESLGEIAVPVDKFINVNNEDKELQVDYNEVDNTFAFKLKQKD
jgi:hypothetical protein